MENKPPTDGRRQKVVVEYHTDGVSQEWWVMFHRGEVEVFDTAERAFKAVQKKASRGNKSFTVTTIEWRNVPEGFKPPTGDAK